jgi:hypothetical protein
MLDHLRWVPLLLGVLVGLIAMYVYKPEKQVIHQYPHPSEASKKIFRDRNGACYTYSSHAVDCDANEGTLKDYPIQG